MQESKKRRVYFVDRAVQGALLLKVVKYWFLSLMVMFGVTLLGWMFVSPGITILLDIREHIPALLGAFIVSVIVAVAILPFILLDVVRMSNRFAGPLFRLKNAMNKVAKGESVQPIKFRDNDFWQEIADSFNEVLAHIEENKSNQNQSTSNLEPTGQARSKSKENPQACAVVVDSPIVDESVTV